MNNNSGHILSDWPLKYQLELKDRALSSTAEGITISDNLQPDNPIIYANKGFELITGYLIEEVLGRNCRFLQGPDTDSLTKDEIRQAIIQEKNCTVEILNYRKDGTPFWNRLSITPVKNDEGVVANYIGIQSDVTKRKNAENELKKTSMELEYANNRMKKDLEEARMLQLSMLPGSIPDLPYLEIAASLKTANEVGGDYYDFHVDQQNKLTIAVGDATGHGLKAGTIVTATKSLFNFFVKDTDPVNILQNISFELKKMGFRNMYMAMLIAIVDKDCLLLSSAGMPYTYIYKAKEATVSEIILKGVPLGFVEEYQYDSKSIELDCGDTILFLSDGLPELYNQKNEFFGDELVKSIFQDNAEKKPDQIIKALQIAAEDWTGSDEVNDDMTLIVLKVK